MRCSLTEHILPLKEPLVTAMGPIARRLVWVVAIEDDVGRVGLGEAAPLPVFGGEDPPTCAEILNQALPLLSDDVVLGWTERGRPDAAIGRLEHLFAHAPCARSAVEGALIDLLAQRRGESLAEVLAGGPALEQVPVNCLIAGTIPDIEAQVERALAAGFRTFKLKVGGDVFADGKRLQVLRSLIGPDARIRIDGNGAWDLEQARFFLTTARDSAVEFCEQPLREHDLEGMATLRKSGGVALAVDEGIRQPTDVARVAAAQAADIIVLKPMF
ncbi:MAG: hypothetical protein H0W72_11025, partial [Planctomycetes bacterium]|nr:hypothetical protein [Planctomycetota bacterium]